MVTADLPLAGHPFDYTVIVKLCQATNLVRGLSDLIV